MAMARYGADQVPSPPYAAGILQCRSVDANGLPTGCVPIDPSHFGFAAMRACETGAAARRSRFTRFDFNRTRRTCALHAHPSYVRLGNGRGNVRVSPRHIHRFPQISPNADPFLMSSDYSLTHP